MTSDPRWKQIEDFPNYWVSDYGDVYSLRHRKYINQSWSGSSFYIQLSHKGKHSNRSVSKLVITHHGEPMKVAHQETSDESSIK